MLKIGNMIEVPKNQFILEWRGFFGDWDADVKEKVYVEDSEENRQKIEIALKEWLKFYKEDSHGYFSLHNIEIPQALEDALEELDISIPYDEHWEYPCDLKLEIFYLDNNGFKKSVSIED